MPILGTNFCSSNISVKNTDEMSLHGQNPTAHCVLNAGNDFGILKHNAVLSKVLAWKKDLKYWRISCNEW